jgi:FtsP/CotA-like multicopper oxidase with cupredoxin domain
MHEILPGVRTEVWGYDGIFPGPTLVSRSGRRTVVQHRNELSVPTVVHLHGGHTPATSDGYPTDLILPSGSVATGSATAGVAAVSATAGVAAGATGMASMPGMPNMTADPSAVITQGTREYVYPFQQRAATLWYHDHRMGFTGPSVWRGLAGFHLVHDDEEDALPLPGGERDIPLMLADRAFAADGSLLYPAVDPSGLHQAGVQGAYDQGVLGDVILVNGAPWPELEVDAVRYRFRVLNASNARRYRIGLDPAPPGGAGLVQIGSDGGLLAAPIAHDTIDLSPAERFDLVIDFSHYRVGDVVTLRNLLGSGSTANVMRFRVVRGATRDESRIPARLAAIEPLAPSSAVARRTFLFAMTDDGWTINGARFDPAGSGPNPRLGTVEIWRFISDFQHSIHMHLGQFQIVGRDGRGPGPFDAGWKDTVDLSPAQAIDVIVRFDDYRGRFLFHCHNLEHEDMAMMANFHVV